MTPNSVTDEIDLGDTIGMGTSIRTANLSRAMNAVVEMLYPKS